MVDPMIPCSTNVRGERAEHYYGIASDRLTETAVREDHAHLRRGQGARERGFLADKVLVRGQAGGSCTVRDCPA